MSGVSTSGLDGSRRPSRSLLAPSDSALEAARGANARAVRSILSPNPDPFNCEIVSAEESSTCQILLVHYPTCTTYEGNKLLLFAPGVSLEQIAGQGAIDPHFTSGSRYVHPIARIEPTERGLAMARAAAAAAKDAS
jgi:hypothetical protein